MSRTSKGILEFLGIKDSILYSGLGGLGSTPFAFCRLLSGRKLTSLRIRSKHSCSLLAKK